MQPNATVTATLISYLHTCHRKLWLHAHEIRMEHTSDLVAEGRLIGDTAYDRRPEQYTQVALEGVKIDYFDPRTATVHETKRGRAIEKAHRAQVKYYLYALWRHGVEGASGRIEYPELRRSEMIPPLTAADIAEIESWVQAVQQLVAQPDCPPAVLLPICKNCSFYDLCYVGE